MSLEKYLIRLEWDADSECFNADYPDLPGLHAYGNTPTEACEMLLQVAPEWLEITTSQGLPIPPPITREQDDQIRLRAALCGELAEALRDILGLVQAGMLIRDISGDGEPGWAIKQLPLVVKLKASHAALAKFDGMGGKE